MKPEILFLKYLYLPLPPCDGCPLYLGLFLGRARLGRAKKKPEIENGGLGLARPD
jgi:hypothetical protein